MNATHIDTQLSLKMQAQTFSMSPRAKELAEDCATRKSLLIALSDNQCFSDAIMLLSYAMPYKKGIRWALNCAQQSTPVEPADQDKQHALDATEKWLDKPNEENRKDMLPNGTVAQPTSVTWLAMATYWSGGCIELSEKTINESAPDGLINDSIYSSVMLSVQESEEKNQLNAYSEAVSQGIEILYT